MSRAKGAALNRKETEMAQFKKAKFYTIGSNGDGKQVYLRDGYTFEKHGLTWGIYKTPILPRRISGGLSTCNLACPCPAVSSRLLSPATRL